MGDMNPATRSFATWIEFEIPATVTFEAYTQHGGYSYDPKILSVFQIYRSALGYIESLWGRLTERPETVLVISCEIHSPDFLALGNSVLIM